MPTPRPGPSGPDVRPRPSAGGRRAQVRTGVHVTVPKPVFDKVATAPPSKVARSARRPGGPTTSRAATVVSSLLLSAIVLGGFFVAMKAGSELLSEFHVERDSSLVNYTSFVLTGGFLMAWAAAAVVGVGLAYRLRGRWEGLFAPLAAVGVFGALAGLAVLACAPYR